MRAWFARCLARLTSETPTGAPIWSGQPPPARIIVVGEPWGGHGDAICLARYLPLLEQAGYQVAYKCGIPGLSKLLAQSFAGGLEFRDEMISKKKSAPLPVPTFLLQQMYIARAFNGKLTPHGFGSGAPHQKLEYRPRKKVKAYVPEKPYLRADPYRVAYYRKRVPPDAIGLCWASGIYPFAWSRLVQPKKSMSLATMVPIWSRHPCVSLQIGPDRAQLAGTPVLDVLPPRPDWAETAALVMALRCVVCVDTAVAHLAGGLGVDVHLAMHAEPNSYFNVAGVPSPWYRTVTLYRGKGADWSGAIARIAAALG
jgi:hypothetical protein